MKYAAFKLIGEPSKTRVGSISADGKSVNEYELGVDLSESGVVEILRLELAGKLPSQASATHPMSAIQLVAPIPRPRLSNIKLKPKILGRSASGVTRVKITL